MPDPSPPINLDAPQGSPEWHAARIGKITASQFGRLVKPASGKRSTGSGIGGFSDDSEKYLRELAGETLTGLPVSDYENAAMRWGHEHEDTARHLYGLRTGQDVEVVGSVGHPEESLISGSPDGLVGSGGGIEIKCPFTTAEHVAYRLDGVPNKHLPQIYGNMWINDSMWWDFVSFDPRIEGPDTIHMALVIHRVKWDATYIENLEAAVFAGVEALKQTLDEMRTK